MPGCLIVLLFTACTAAPAACMFLFARLAEGTYAFWTGLLAVVAEVRLCRSVSQLLRAQQSTIGGYVWLAAMQPPLDTSSKDRLCRLRLEGCMAVAIRPSWSVKKPNPRDLAFCLKQTRCDFQCEAL